MAAIPTTICTLHHFFESFYIDVSSLVYYRSLWVPHYYYVSRQHGKDVGARVVSRQAPAATSTRRSEVFVWRYKRLFPAVSRLNSFLAGNYGAEDGAVGRYRGFDVQSAPGSLPEAKYGRDRCVRGLEIL